MPDTLKIAGIVLAAGKSERMGEANKLLVELDGVAVIARTVAQAKASKLAAVFVVTGHECREIEAVLRGQRVSFVHNELYREGMATSLKAGVKAVSTDFDGAMILLGDMPLVTPTDIDLMIGAFGSRNDICVPVSGDKQGNPVLWGQNWFEEMCKLAGDNGAKSLLQRHKARVVEVLMPAAGVLLDFDTKADFGSLN